MEHLTAFLTRMPKVELHVHLESTMPGEMLARFAARQGRELPRPAERLYDCSAEDLSDFLAFLDNICSFVGTPEELAEAAEHAALESGREHILYSEMILNPTHWPQFSVPEIIAAVTAGFDRAAAQGGADCRFTLSLSRTQTGAEAMALVEDMKAHRTHRLAGLSIDGNEALAGRTGERFRPAFLAAGAAGFGRTAHAGESSGPDGVRDALDSPGGGPAGPRRPGGRGRGFDGPAGAGAGAAEHLPDLQPDTAVPAAGGSSPAASAGCRGGGDPEPGRSYLPGRADPDGGAAPGRRIRLYEP